MDRNLYLSTVILVCFFGKMDDPLLLYSLQMFNTQIKVNVLTLGPKIQEGTCSEEVSSRNKSTDYNMHAYPRDM
jgi:hypothetical protein